MDNIYVLVDQNNNTWGIFLNKTILYNMFYNLKKMNKNNTFSIHEYISNSNIIKNIINEEDFDDFVSIQIYEKKEKGEHIPKEIKREVDKIKEKLSIFKENYIVFKKLLNDNIIKLDETNIDNIPKLFRDKFYIYRDIILKKVPDEDAFSYFSDRYIPNMNSLEIINDISDIDLFINKDTETSDSETDSEEE